jgi:hypothetical protein
LLSGAGEIRSRAAGDGKEPWPQGAGSAERGKLAICFDKRLLGRVLGGVVVAEDRPGGGMDDTLVASNDVRVSLTVAAENRADESFVGLRRARFQCHHIQIDEDRGHFAAAHIKTGRRPQHG